jgi:hypothetical protein
MASRRVEYSTRAKIDDVWQAARDIGALHTRLVPGFVVDTKLEPGARVVTFVSGVVVREPIVAIDNDAKRLVWTSEGGRARHYNASLQAFSAASLGTRLVWIADFLPDEIAPFIEAAMSAGAKAMQGALDRLA